MESCFFKFLKYFIFLRLKFIYIILYNYRIFIYQDLFYMNLCRILV
jgi:hypothetical protein